MIFNCAFSLSPKPIRFPRKLDWVILSREQAVVYDEEEEPKFVYLETSHVTVLRAKDLWNIQNYAKFSRSLPPRAWASDNTRSQFHFFSSIRRDKSLARMFSYILTFVVLIAFSATAAKAASQTCDNCPSIPKHYEELGCTPVKKNGQCCVSR